MVVEGAKAVAEMTPEMAKAVVEFLHTAWPMQAEGDPPRRGWDHMFSTSYQLACMALVALGEAEETGWGAIPFAEPRPPEVLPLWEDIAVVVLWLARQQNLLTYRQRDGTPPRPRGGGFVVHRIGGPPPAPPNILAGPGSGPAHMAEIVLPVLGVLGLIRDARWTHAAETVLWRGMPGAWELGFEADARFLAAVEEAVARVLAISVLPVPASPSRKRGRPSLRERKTTVASAREAT